VRSARLNHPLRIRDLQVRCAAENVCLGEPGGRDGGEGGGDIHLLEREGAAREPGHERHLRGL
jgi:hypothetical protein